MLYSNNPHGYQPGFSFVHRNIRHLISNPDSMCLDNLSDQEINIIRKKIDDYVMYIWLHLGDTRYNRTGYRNAVDKLTQLLNK